MSGNSIFNATVCLIGIIILLVHTVNLSIKKGKRKDENRLLAFFIFTIVHFATYLTFTLIKINYTSDAFITAFYSTFYVMNNLEVFFLFVYTLSYAVLSEKGKKALFLFNVSLLAVFILTDILNVFTGIYFSAQGGEYVRGKNMILSQGYQFVTFTFIFVIAVLNKQLNIRERVAFFLYCLLPFGAIVLQNVFKGYAIAYASIIVATEILFLFLNVAKNIELSKVEEKNKAAQIKIMMSQIQPHFIYNTLSSISTLITIDPVKAERALDDFTEYLRANLSSLTETRLIPFENELKHIKTYVALEKIRFNDRVNVNYNIKANDFKVPPLSIQPIVENSIKHGILKKLEGGTLTLNTYETESSFVVEITDDGVGFDVDDKSITGNDHVGLNNIKYRLFTMCRGDIKIESEKDKGTKVSVVFYK